MEKKKTWTKNRHKFFTFFGRPVVSALAKFKYHAKVGRFREEGQRNWLVLVNHQTDFDQCFISLAFKKPVYFVAMEDLFSNGLISRLLSFAVAPIPILKAATDLNAIRTCFKVAKEGGNIALFPEGNRTYSGQTCYIKPAVAGLAMKLGLPIAIFKIEGGFGIKPRWADNRRKGTMNVGVSRIIEPEEYKKMTKDELYQLICRELWVDETKDSRCYESGASAEGLERVLYVCPDCGMSEFESRKDVVSCKSCGKSYRYLANKRLEAVNGRTPFKFLADWYTYQEAFIRKLDLSEYSDKPIFSETANLSEVVVFKKKKMLQKEVGVRIYSDRLELDTDAAPAVLPYTEIKAMACIACHKLNIFYQDRIFQLKGGKSFNALKYCNIYYHAKFTSEAHEEGEFEFLGL